MTDYYQISQDGKSLIKVKRIYVTEDVTLILGNADDFAKYRNAYPIAPESDPPDPPIGKIAVRDGWELVNGEWNVKWKYEDEPAPPPRTFSKLKVVAALMKAGVWPQVKAYIEQSGLYDLYLAAQIFSEDNEYFTAGKTQLQTALGWTDSQVESVLKASIAS